MRHPEYLIVVVLFLAIIYFYNSNQQSYSIKKMIRKRKAKDMKDVLDGEEVRIKGKIVFVGKTLLAPLSQRKCVYYQVLVNDSSAQKEILKNHLHLSETRATDIVLFDGLHYAIINKQKLQAHVLFDHSQSSGFWQITSEELVAFLKRKVGRTKDYVGWSLDLFAEESVLEEGETVEVLGTAKWKSSSLFKELRIPADEVLYIEPAADNGVYLTDEALY